MASILCVNMTGLTTKLEESPQKYHLLGGRDLTSTIVTEEVAPDRHPLGPDNKVALAPCIVAGTPAPCAGRLSINGKSSLRGGLGEVGIGGLVAEKLARLGFKAIVAGIGQRC